MTRKDLRVEVLEDLLQQLLDIIDTALRAPNSLDILDATLIGSLGAIDTAVRRLDDIRNAQQSEAVILDLIRPTMEAEK